jgi:hypothetical protein
VLPVRDSCSITAEVEPLVRLEGESRTGGSSRGPAPSHDNAAASAAAVAGARGSPRSCSSPPNENQGGTSRDECDVLRWGARRGHVVLIYIACSGPSEPRTHPSRAHTHPSSPTNAHVRVGVRPMLRHALARSMSMCATDSHGCIHVDEAPRDHAHPASASRDVGHQSMHVRVSSTCPHIHIPTLVVRGAI